jgi:hypothetical protein
MLRNGGISIPLVSKPNTTRWWREVNARRENLSPA